MGYFNCRRGEHDDCNGYIGPLDTYTCLCPCHESAAELYGWTRGDILLKGQTTRWSRSDGGR